MGICPAFHLSGSGWSPGLLHNLTALRIPRMARTSDGGWRRTIDPFGMTVARFDHQQQCCCEAVHRSTDLSSEPLALRPRSVGVVLWRWDSHGVVSAGCSSHCPRHGGGSRVSLNRIGQLSTQIVSRMSTVCSHCLRPHGQCCRRAFLSWYLRSRIGRAFHGGKPGTDDHVPRRGHPVVRC